MTGYTHYHSKYLAQRIMLEGNGEEAFAKSLSTARVDMKPHQVEAARFALHSPLSKGVLLADEVGLGKTIEACLVIAQKWAERRRNILLIVPASLRTQWQQELAEKFSLPSFIMAAKTYRDAVKAGIKLPFDSAEQIIITSYQYAARKSDEVHRVGWDLVVIDEAHRLRNVYKSGQSSQAKKLKEALSSRFKVLLTATPLQNSLMELYGLVSVIDDNFFGDEQSFRVMYGRAADRTALGSLRRRMAPLYKRHLRRDVQKAGHVKYTERMAVTFDFEPYDLETRLYEGVSEYLQRKDSIAFGSKPNQLVLIGARKTLGSSIAAIIMFLENVVGRLRRQQRADESVVADIDDTADVKEEIADDAMLGKDRGETADDDNDATAIDPKVLAAELAELEGYLELARSIGANAKGEKLIAKLPEVLDAVVERQGKRKVVIFTESVRTQHYLFDILSQNGYEGQIVLMNGSNTDPESQKIYKAWKKEKEGTGAVSGSKSADMKSAIVSAFKSDEKTILIATESGGEGINLQFCSLLINFDLPWNPQRVEQRIGRCHRYGQAIDVTVVNMLNRKNQAEQRIYELLRNKFNLFEGVFGASDQVLGSIESGIDFEKKVLSVVQSCRTEAEVNEAFARLEAELDDQIKADMAETRQQLFDLFDASIVDMLKQRGSAIERSMSDFERRLWLVARAELPEAEFRTDGVSNFAYDGRTWSTAWPEAEGRGWNFFRLGDYTLADGLVRKALGRELPTAKLAFSYQAYRDEGQPRLSDLEQLAGAAGWLRVSLLKAETAVGSRDSLVLAGIADDGAVLACETAERLFQLPARVDEPDASYPADRMVSIDAAALATAQRAAEDENRKWLDEETTKLEAYATDLERASDLRVDELAKEVKAARKALREDQSLSMAARLEEQRRIKQLERERDDLKMSFFKRKREVEDEIEGKLDEVAEKLAITPRVMPLMTIRWEIAV